MKNSSLTRRDALGALLGSAAAIGTAGAGSLVAGRPAEAKEHGARRAAELSAEEMAAVDQALGKKGTLNQEQAVYTVPLPRADLKMKVQGDPVPTPFGFGGWVSFKKTRDGKSTVLMSDCVL